MKDTKGETIVFCNRKTVDVYLSRREGEKKVGETIALPEGETIEEILKKARHSGVHYVLMGVPESVGPMANHGASGAQNGWHAFLASFLNMQDNTYLSGKSILCLGHVNMRGLQAETGRLQKGHNEYFSKLRELCEKIDKMVESVAAEIYRQKLIPIVIGGGHNNAYPLIKAAAENSKEGKVNCINCDPHADFRQAEGRHSGNSFSYAWKNGYLNRYAVMGLHRNYNSQPMLDEMDKNSSVYYTFREEEKNIVDATENAVNFLNEKQLPCGIEFDMDSIALMPVSAFTPSGLTVEEARTYLRKAVQFLQPAYLHLPEAAPLFERDEKITGKALAYLVADFVYCYKCKA